MLKYHILLILTSHFSWPCDKLIIVEKKKKLGEDQRNSDHMPKIIRLRSAILVNLRPTTGIQAISYTLSPFFQRRSYKKLISI